MQNADNTYENEKTAKAVLAFHPGTDKPIIPPAVLATGLRLGRAQDLGRHLDRALACLKHEMDGRLPASH